MESKDAHYIEIGGRRIGPGYPTYIVAEMSANHNQDYDQAVKILTAAKNAGADAVKLQTYTADTLTIDCDNEYFQIKGTLWDGRTLHGLYSEAFMPWEWQPKLKVVADELGIDLFSAPFDSTAIEFLEAMDVPAFKVASFENVDIPLIRQMALTGKPIIMSTGMASLAEIDEAVATVRQAGGQNLALLKCTSAYPAPPEEMNLRSIKHLAEAFQVPSGLSDHTLGTAVPIAAVALGACIVEKHFTLSRSDGGEDAAFSIEPDELRTLVIESKRAWLSLGELKYGPSPSENSMQRFRQSLFAAHDIKKGTVVARCNIPPLTDSGHSRLFRI